MGDTELSFGEWLEDQIKVRLGYSSVRQFAIDHRPQTVNRWVNNLREKYLTRLADALVFKVAYVLLKMGYVARAGGRFGNGA